MTEARVGESSNDSIIELEPFIHQVGGRSTILVLGDYICKPINERELAFYESLDQFGPQLKPFAPRYNGTISVNFEESNDGYLIITTKSQTPRQEKNMSKHLQSSSPYHKFETKYRIKLCRPLKEIIIESHEQDLDRNYYLDLEASKSQLENLLLADQVLKTSDAHDLSGNSSISQSATNLYRSRSTSISIPNFEDGNIYQSDLTSLFDNQLFTNEAGQNGFNRESRNRVSTHVQSGAQSGEGRNLSPSRNVVYNRSTTKHNPWVLKTFAALGEFNETMKEQKFILLENLVANFEYPCVMDLKMGTRLHDDSATQTKKQSHESKVNETTSGALGLRITGIQVYDKDLDRFICYNKYYGRKLTPETFRSTLKMFVSNENFVHHGLLDKLIEKLKQLRSVIVQLETFRFYTSSLLLIYEGNMCQCEKPQWNSCECCTTAYHSDRLFDVRVIDFAHSTHANLSSQASSSAASPESSPTSPRMPLVPQGYDEGFVFGLDNLIKILTLFRNEPSN